MNVLVEVLRDFLDSLKRFIQISFIPFFSLLFVNTLFYFTEEKIDKHIDIKIFINEKPLDFLSLKYNCGNNKGNESKLMYFYKDDFEVLHIEDKKNVRLVQLFESLNMWKDGCLLINNTKYCDMKLYIKRIIWVESNISTYRPYDTDQVLLTDGKGDLEMQKNSVTSKSCLYSKKCHWIGIIEHDVNKIFDPCK